MSWQDSIKGIISFITGEALVGAMDEIKDTVDQTTRKVIKAMTLYVMFVIGLLFLLIGLAAYIQARFVLMDGMGLIIIGVVIILLGVFAKAMR